MSGNEREYIELSTFTEDIPGSDTSNNTEELNESSSKNWKFTNDQYQLILLRLGLISDDELNPGNAIDVEILKSTSFMLDKIDKLEIVDAIGILREALVEHKGDVNYLQEDFHLIERLVSTIPEDFDKVELKSKLGENDSTKNLNNVEEKNFGLFKNKTYLNIVDWALQIRLEASLIAYHSPYPEIRALVEPCDDPTIPVETLRVYVIGLSWTIIGSIINNFFVHRLPSISLGLHTVQLLLLPSGKLWEKMFPYNKKLMIFGKEINLNPGPWTYKEMMLTTIIYSCSSGTPYLIYNIFVMKLDRFYGLKWVSWVYQILFALSVQFLGYSFAFFLLKVCIYPKRALWPSILPTIALNRALMNDEPKNQPPIHGWKISRYSFFIITFVISFFYNALPSYFFTALSNFNWPTWFQPDLIHLNNITGFNSGLGLNPIPSFDWNILDSASCLTIPFYTYANQYLGSFLGFLIIIILYYTNNNWTAYLPINSNRLFNNKGEVYKIHDILDENNAFDQNKYLDVGPPYFSSANLLIYLAFFVLYPFSILFHVATEWESTKQSFISIWQTIKDACKKNLDPNIHSQFGRYINDPHCKMMSKYEEVPGWWFLTILLLSTTFGVLCVSLYPTETPIWGIFFTIIINFIFLIPITAIASVTGFSFGLNVLVELIVGYAIPNSGIALITLKSYGYNIDTMASNYITDQKLGHYTKIPPKAIFRGQLISTLISVFVALIIANWQITHIEDICDLHQKNKLRCPGANTFFYSSIQYGEIGPAKVFGGIYPFLKWCFLLGALLVIPCAWFKKNGPPKLARYFQPTVIIGGLLLYAPYNLLYYTGGLYLSYIFMYRIKKNYLLWWEKYNYVLTSALSAAVAFSSLAIFFLQYNGNEIEWWGNQVNNQGIEGASTRPSWLQAKDAPDGYIGLRKGNYP